MSGTNDSFTFGSSEYNYHEFDELPKGVCFSLAMNPYNGLVVVRYNRSAAGVAIVDSLLRQIEKTRWFIKDALQADEIPTLQDVAEYCDGALVVPDFEPCPFCGEKPEYVEVTPYSMGDIVCCDGRLRFEGFTSRAQAVKAWNDRTAFRVPTRVA